MSSYTGLTRSTYVERTAVMTDREAAEAFSKIARCKCVGRLATGAGRSKVTAQQWRDGRQAPSLASAISLGRDDPEINDWIKREIDRRPSRIEGQGDLFDRYRN